MEPERLKRKTFETQMSFKFGEKDEGDRRMFSVDRFRWNPA